MDYVQNFTEKLAQDAENIVNNIFPKKVEQLDILLSDPSLNLKQIKNVREQSWDSMKSIINSSESDGAKSTIKIITQNEILTRTLDLIREEVCLMMESCNTLRLWVTLLLPKIEDGNNFGVSVQAESMSEIKQVETEATLYLSQISTYFLSRAKIATKLIKHPQVLDYQRYVVEEDEKQFVNIRFMVAELRNSYSSIHDLLLKNMEKIKKPKVSNFASMY